MSKKEIRKQYKKRRIELLDHQERLNQLHCKPCKNHFGSGGCDGCDVLKQLQQIGTELANSISKKKEGLQQMALTVKDYSYWKEKGKTDKQIMMEYGMNNVSFNKWKKENGLIKAKETEKQPPLLKENDVLKETVKEPVVAAMSKEVTTSLQAIAGACSPALEKAARSFKEATEAPNSEMTFEQAIANIDENMTKQVPNDRETHYSWTMEKQQLELTIQNLQQMNEHLQNDLLQAQEDHEAALHEIDHLKAVISRYEQQEESRKRLASVCNLLMQEINFHRENEKRAVYE